MDLDRTFAFGAAPLCRDAAGSVGRVRCRMRLRSLFPRVDLERVCLWDTWLSAILLGRTSTCLRAARDCRRGRLLVRVLSINHIGHVIEESLWALMKHDTKVSPIPTSNRSLRTHLVSWHCESVTTQTLVPEVLR